MQACNKALHSKQISEARKLQVMHMVLVLITA